MWHIIARRIPRTSSILVSRQNFWSMSPHSPSFNSCSTSAYVSSNFTNFNHINILNEFKNKLLNVVRLYVSDSSSPIERVQRFIIQPMQNVEEQESSASPLHDNLFLSSTVKKRHMKMNKHKLKKRRKLLRMNTKVSRG